jgi:hypothetical protein
VSDTGHHRVLVWWSLPDGDGAPADAIIGQPSFDAEGRNARGDVSARTLNVPTGLAADGEVLAIADAWNHRVLIWHRRPSAGASYGPPDVVVGQADPTSGSANRGAERARGDTLNWCYGVAICQGRLIVADTGNRRVLIWDRIPETNGAHADHVLGQRDFETRDENAGHDAGDIGMRWPHGLAQVGTALLVADAGNNRVMVWRSFPARNGAPCDLVLGQASIHAVDHNRGRYEPTESSLNMSYSVVAQRGRAIVADTANSRLVAFDAEVFATGRANALTGQTSFADKGDNRWGVPTRDSVCWPYGVSAADETVVVADAGNNRVLVWEAAR